MGCNKTALFIISTTLFSNSASVAEETGFQTFDGTRLELILQAEDGEIIFNNLEALTTEERNDVISSFHVIPLRNNGYLASGFYILNSSAGIQKYTYTQEPKAYVHPSKNGDCYLVCRGAYSNFSFDDYSPVIKELYDVEDRLIWAHEIKGHVKVSDDLGNVLIRNLIRGPGIAVINKGRYTYFDPRYCGKPFCISTDGGIIVIAENDARVPARGPKGTRVYDNHGELLFTLNPEFVANVGTSTQQPGVIFASSRYIIQICHKAKRTGFEPTIYDSDGEELDGITTVPSEQYLQVYDRNGKLKWQKVFATSRYCVKFSVAENEEYIAVILPEPKPECWVFDLTTGEELYNVNLPVDFWHVSDAGISNDGSKLSVVRDKWGGPGNNIVESEALLFNQGLEAAAFENAYDYNETEGSYNFIFSENEGLFVITANRGFRFFRISSD